MMSAKGEFLSRDVHFPTFIVEMISRIPSMTFSQDLSLMAAGFQESYIRLWSLKGKELKGYRNDFQPSQIKDGMYSVVSNAM